MGIGVVLVFWAIVGAMVTSLAAIVFGTVSYLRTRQVPYRRSIAAIVTVSAFPFLGLGWTATMFVFQAIVNETILHRDPGIGDSWQCPLPNGYAILMIDEPDQGTVYNPKSQVSSDGGVAVGKHDRDAVDGVRKLQMAGKYILGGADTKAFDSFRDAKDRMDEYFLAIRRLAHVRTFPATIRFAPQ